MALGALASGAAYIVGTNLAVRAGREKRPDLMPTYSPWHVMLDPTEPKRVAVVFNPSKPKALHGCRVIRDQMEEAGWDEAIFFETTVEDPGYSMAKDAVEAGAEIVIAVGGDGTVREVARAVANTDVRLGIVPLGTGNLLARNLDIPFDDTPACINMALHGERQQIDMVSLTMETAEGKTEEHDFMVMGGAGFDAQIMTDTREELKSRFGWIAYLEAAAKNLVAPRRSVRIEIDDKPAFGRKIRSVLIANTGTLQGGVQLAPDTNLQDGHFEIVVLTPRNLLGWLSLSTQVLSRRKQRFPAVENFVGSEAKVSFLKQAQPVEIDGDVIGEATSLSVKVHPGAVAINLYPEGKAQTRRLSEIPQELLESRERIQREFEETSDALLKEFTQNAAERRETIEKWFRGEN